MTDKELNNMDNKATVENMIEKEEVEISIEEFAIVELEDRLELAGRCNPGCSSN